jgi:hypothetical protein
MCTLSALPTNFLQWVLNEIRFTSKRGTILEYDFSNKYGNILELDGSQHVERGHFNQRYSEEVQERLFIRLLENDLEKEYWAIAKRKTLVRVLWVHLMGYVAGQTQENLYEWLTSVIGQLNARPAAKGQVIVYPSPLYLEGPYREMRPFREFLVTKLGPTPWLQTDV